MPPGCWVATCKLCHCGQLASFGHGLKKTDRNPSLECASSRGKPVLSKSITNPED